MTTVEPRPEMDELLGVYVLDALEADERELVERYMEGNEQARTEVDELRETVAVLAGAPPVDEPASPELWARIEADIVDDESEQGRDELAARRARGGRRRTVWISSAVAAVAAAAAIVLALQVVSLNDDLDQANQPTSENIAKQFEEATEVEGARTVALDSDRGAAEVVLLPDGTGYLRNDTLPALPDEQTYQLWVSTGEGADARFVSAAVLGPDPTAAGFQVAGPVQAFAMTIEQEGGAGQPTQDPFTLGPVA